MYSTCLHCTRDLGSNDVVEALPIGRRLAFDVARGRLWVVCRSCGKWNLVPFDNRLEAIDACAKRFHDTKTRFSTDNIGLARMADGLELVRIGEPQRPEFASWRYGAQYKRRRRVNIAFASAGLLVPQFAIHWADAAFANMSFVPSVALSLLPLFGVVGALTYVDDVRLRVHTRIPGQPGAFKLSVNAAGSAHLQMVDGEPTLAWRQGFIGGYGKRSLGVSGPAARQVLRKILGIANRNVGSANDLNGAVQRIDQGGVEGWLARIHERATNYSKARMMDRHRVLSSQAWPWGDSPRQPMRLPGYHAESVWLMSLAKPDRLAIEMWLSEEDEARALAGELALLERQWKEAEELAAIADGLSLGEGTAP